MSSQRIFLFSQYGDISAPHASRRWRPNRCHKSCKFRTPLEVSLQEVSNITSLFDVPWGKISNVLNSVSYSTEASLNTHHKYHLWELLHQKFWWFVDWSLKLGEDLIILGNLQVWFMPLALHRKKIQRHKIVVWNIQKLELNKFKLLMKILNEFGFFLCKFGERWKIQFKIKFYDKVAKISVVDFRLGQVMLNNYC